MARRLLELPHELLAALSRKLSARGLVRLACTCHQLHAVCLAEAESAILELLAAGERDDPLPTSLVHLETVFHRLARLCGGRFAPANFICGIALECVIMGGRSDPTFGEPVPWDLAAVEKLHVVFSHCRTEKRWHPWIHDRIGLTTTSLFGMSSSSVASPSSRTAIHDEYEVPIGGEDHEIYREVIRSALTYMEHAREIIVRREHVDLALKCSWSTTSVMKRTRALLEQHEAAGDGRDYEPTEEDEDEDDEVDLGQLVDGGADAVGVLVDDTWYPSLSCALSLKNDDLELGAVYDEEYDDGTTMMVSDSALVDMHSSLGCINPLCCHTWMNCRLAWGAMLPELWPGEAGDGDAPTTHRVPGMFGIPKHEYMWYRPAHLDRLARCPNTSRLQPHACPRAKIQRKRRAECRKWIRRLRPAALAELGIPVVESVRFGDAYDAGRHFHA
jgi:hypothetical protein